MREKDFTKEKIKELLDKVDNMKSLAVILEIVKSFSEKGDR